MVASEPKKEVAQPAPRNLGDYFGVCLLVMDDNHYLPEWLAYHYTFLPLRRLIVAVDPKSRTSPSGIFDRFRGLMNITEWGDNKFLPVGFDSLSGSDEHMNVDNPIAIHRYRQKYFYKACTEALKEESSTTWVAFVDSDEYIAPNWGAKNLKNAKARDLIVHYNNQMTVLDIFRANRRMNLKFKSPCLPMRRIPVTIRESPHDEVCRNVPDGINASTLMTLRFRYARDVRPDYIPGKSMVDLSRVNASDIRSHNHNVHRPVRSVCTEVDLWLARRRSPFVVYHYPGTLDAFLFRKDPRNGTRTEEQYYGKYSNMTELFEEDSARFWIFRFVENVTFWRKRKNYFVEPASLGLNRNL